MCYALCNYRRARDITRWLMGKRVRSAVSWGAINLGHDLRIFVSAIVYAFTGMALLLIGYRIFDALAPIHLQKEIFEDDNVAVAIVVGFFLLGVAVVIHGAFSV